jgi:hypothetical protein
MLISRFGRGSCAMCELCMGDAGAHKAGHQLCND